MRRRTVIAVAALLAVAEAALVAATLGGRAAPASAAAGASPLCKGATIGSAGPLTGGAAFIGTDQRNWLRLFLSYWNGGKPILGVPKGLARPKLKEVDGDSQLNPQVSATVAGQMVSNKSVLA